MIKPPKLSPTPKPPVGAPPVVVPSSEEACPWVFFEACWTTVADHAYNATIASPSDQAAAIQGMVDSISATTRPVLRPNGEYLVEIDTVDEISEQGTIKEAHKRSHVIGFRTEGPPGQFHEFPRNNVLVKHPDHRPDAFALDGIAPYIDYGRSYPRPDGNLLGAKPLYTEAASIHLLFNRPYVERMFSDWKALGPGAPEISSALRLELADPGVNPSPPDFSGGSVPPTLQPVIAATASLAFVPDVSPTPSAEVAMLGNLIALGPGCAGPLAAPQPPATYVEASLAGLAPQTLYTAIWFSEFDGRSAEVHRYQFQTSRYASFSDQVHSYLPVKSAAEEPVATAPALARVFEHEAGSVPTPTDVAAVIGGTPPAALSQSHAVRFDQVIDGIFAVTELAAATGTEFTAIRGGADVVALLVRNPEPLNDTRLPDSITGATITAPGCETIMSPDLARALVLRADGSPLAPGPLELTFQHWNAEPGGTALSAAETVTIEVP
jgi:hypothetical protein